MIFSKNKTEKENQFFSDVEDVISTLRPNYPIMCLSRGSLEKKSQGFINGFPGTVLYAVKCNNNDFLLRTLYSCGIRSFDTASLDEIAQIKANFPDAHCFFNHPVKSREAIRVAYYKYGIRDFVIDSEVELDKILYEIRSLDITIQVRIKTKPNLAVYNLSQKFGASIEEAIKLLQRLKFLKIRSAISFHVGSQCAQPLAYANALEDSFHIMQKAQVTLVYINVGGGFPAPYWNKDVPKHESFFDLIKQKKEALGLPPLICEPGRALVSHSGILVVQIHMRRGRQLYINDGLYGSLGEVNYAKLFPPVKAFRLGGILQRQLENFKVFGPTCDSFDDLDCYFALPDDVNEGDWISIFEMGAYSTVLANRFNGFRSDSVVAIA